MTTNDTTPRVTSPMFAEFGGTRVPVEEFIHRTPLAAWQDGVTFFLLDDQGGRVYSVDAIANRAICDAAIQRQLVGEYSASKIALPRRRDAGCDSCWVLGEPCAQHSSNNERGIA